MPVVMAIVLALTIAGILALWVIWYELDKRRFERTVEESYRDLERLHNQRRETEKALCLRKIREGPMRRGGVKPRPTMPKPLYRPPSQKKREGESK